MRHNDVRNRLLILGGRATQHRRGHQHLVFDHGELAVELGGSYRPPQDAGGFPTRRTALESPTVEWFSGYVAYQLYPDAR